MRPTGHFYFLLSITLHSASVHTEAVPLSSDEYEAIIAGLQRRLAGADDQRMNAFHILREQLGTVSHELQMRISEHELLSQSLVDSRNQAVSADQTKSRFLAMMSHDIRTPMNAILATLDLLGTTDLDDEQRRLLSLTVMGGEQMMFLLSDILEVSRSEAWIIELVEEAVALPLLITDIAQAWRSLARKKGLSFNLNLSPSLPNGAMLDPARLRQVLDNLISNAIKYTPQGFLSLKAENVGEVLRFTVSDSGLGIAEHVQQRLFNAGQRVRNPLGPHIEGTGLGLAICQRLIEAMGGSIGVLSDGMTGSHFWFEIPFIAAAGCAPSAENPSKPTKKLKTPSGAAPHILLAEDVETNRIVMAALLDEIGCTYTIAEDGLAAVSECRHRPFDAVLMDVSMPQMDGMAATTAIRAAGSTLPILGVTAFAAEAERAAMMASGMTSVISKPIRLEALRSELARLLKAATVPQFHNPDVMDINSLRSYIFSVPEKARLSLQKALIADISNWQDRFFSAADACVEPAAARAHHALKGLCLSVGAHKLLTEVDRAYETVRLGQQPDTSAAKTALKATLDAIADVGLLSDRRKRA